MPACIGGYAYGKGVEGTPARAAFETRLGQIEAVVQNHGNREHGVLDSDDYYQFEGEAAAVATLQGRERPIWHNDHSRPETPKIRALDDGIGREIRSRVVNPKWIEGVKRHGYKGAFEIAAMVRYLFAFAVTTRTVKPHHFDLVHAAFLEDEATRAFLAEATDPGLWVPRSNLARTLIDGLRRQRALRLT